jgi:2-iminobutanoate/2-iminopropanoate deaminase
MKKEVIPVPDTSQLPFSPAIHAGDYIFVSGQVGFVDAGGREVKDIEAQTRLCLENMKRVLAAAGASLDAVVKVTVFLRSEKDFSAMNKVYQDYFGKDKPARSTVITGLALPSMLVEIECIAYAPWSRQRRTRKTGSKGNLR